MTRLRSIAALLLGLLIIGNTQLARAEDEANGASPSTAKTADASDDKPADAGKKKDRNTHKVTQQPLKINEVLSGVFVADEMAEVALWPEEWSDFEIDEVVAHGSPVKKGETLVKFAAKRLDDAISDLEVEQRLSELKLMRTEQEIPLKEQQLQRGLTEAERQLNRVKEDFERYQDKERQQMLDSADWNLKYAKFSLEYNQEELNQLEKMYEADDLTEDTEEIVLRRQRFSVDAATFEYELSQYNHGVTTNVMVPRRDQDFEVQLKSNQETFETAQLANQVDLNIARYELEKAKNDRKKSLEKHVKLLADRELLTVESPLSGVVYYGACNRGKFDKIASMRDSLKAKKKVEKGTVMMTVVNPDEQHVLVTINEKLLGSIKAGQAVEIRSPAEHTEPLAGKLGSLSVAPVADGEFEAKIELDDDPPEWITPGMSAKVKLVIYEKDDALLIPAKAVHTDDLQDRKYVWIIADDKPQKKWVETGHTKGDKIEVRSGLEEGDIVSLDDEEPAASKP